MHGIPKLDTNMPKVTEGPGTPKHLAALPKPPTHRELAAAAEAGDVERVSALLKAGAPIHPPNETYGTWPPALHAAAKAGHLDTVRLLLDAGADADQADAFGSNPLHVAAISGRCSIARLILDETGMDVDVPDRAGRTPLQEAVQGGSLETARMLLDRGANPNSEDDRKRTPLSKAHDKLDETPDVEEAMAALLIAAGANTMMGDFHLRPTGLMLAAQSGDIERGRAALRSKPEELDAFHFRKGTALHVAAKAGDDEFASLLLEAGASTALSGTNVPAPLHLAAGAGHLRVVSLLLDGMDRDGGCEWPEDVATRALRPASANGHIEVVVALLGAGADPVCTESDETTALDRSKSPEIRAVLTNAAIAQRRRRPPTKPLPDAEAQAKALVSEGPGSRRIPSRSVLQAAVKAQSVETVEALLNAGAAFEPIGTPDAWSSPSVTVARESARRPKPSRINPELRKRLKLFASGLGGGLRDFAWDAANDEEALAWVNSHPGSVNAHYVDALTPLHMAAAYDLPATCARLIELGAYLEKESHNEGTPLELAAKRSGSETVRMLLDAGARITTGSYGVLMTACKAGNAPAAIALLEAGADPNAPTDNPWE